MLRRARFLLATSLPRSAWDPAHHNPNWTDSYATDIAARRHWPAKRWSVALDPRTPRDWLRFSYRNLAYAYNGALRACTTFPEMIVYYTEMKQRGVKVDVDTLNVLLTRAARYEHIQTDDIFLLFDEMTSLGARPDIAAVETLHTVLEHSAQKSFEWREARRRQLVELYNYLAVEEIARLAPHKADALLAAQMARLRGQPATAAGEPQPVRLPPLLCRHRLGRPAAARGAPLPVGVRRARSTPRWSCPRCSCASRTWAPS
ncbi:hypothetical protein STCU_00662 [Strigomonas culicis]|uniref:Pentacotripeptide-repeat region of PRORP domain-containing protein n=1 Tax=Strigomonas culicis TaxID=28005 RepID=S9WK17_9TRYP|nr:hypothetical protein STCU_00662 [Strigomonas culicis]|eukprot:EPY36285.1 hypothetical protein STCU_00662 [Strigomonas culicis]